jgi:colicin import membrane protein
LAKNGDSSLLFSLDSLMAHERDRVAEEAHAAEQQRQAEVAARAEAERHARAEAERRAAEEEARRDAERRRRLEEEARLEGIRRAEAERILAETRREQEIELRVRQSSHDLRLAAEAAVSRARSTRVAFVCTAVVAVVATCGAVYLELGVHRPRLSALAEGYARGIDAEQARRTELQTLLEGSKGRLKNLEEQLRARPTECVTPAAPAGAVRPPSGVRPPIQRPPPRPTRPCKGDPHDPLNPCL